MDERLYWLGFSVFPGIGPARFQKLLLYFGSAKRAWKAPINDLLQSKIGEKLAIEFADFRNRFSPEAYYEELTRMQVNYLTLKDEGYPKLLKQSKQAPFLLYVKGMFHFDNPDNQQTVAIVGSRKITAYGMQVTELFTHELVRAGCVIVSGLALGVDAAAHTVTVENKGRTIAVLGCGVDCCYPMENEGLYDQIIAGGGAIVSEFSLGQQPTKGSFPSRNRIIAGLSQGVVVTEGAEDSGALITAEYAFINNRPVFAVPGPITSSNSKGPYKLIEKGAKFVTRPEEILEALQIGAKANGRKSAKEIKGETKEEQMIIDLLQGQRMHIDDLVRKTKMDSAKISSLLSLLEVKGIVKAMDMGHFCLEI